MSFISSIAQAESWVLWDEMETTGAKGKQDIHWKIVDAYPEHKQCLQGMQRIWEAKEKQAMEDKEKIGSKVDVVRYSYISIMYKKPKVIIRNVDEFYCLPGTLDPREKQ
jgi:hypothetical protein